MIARLFPLDCIPVPEGGRPTVLSRMPLLAGLLAATVHAQPMYTVNQVTTRPTVDGIVNPGEWDAAAPASGNWRLLRTAPPGDPDWQNSRVRMVWDMNGLYALVETDHDVWDANPNTGEAVNFNLDGINFYWDPNTDGEPNDLPDNQVDGYQLTTNQYLGNGEIRNGVLTNATIFSEAHFNTPFGSPANWPGPTGLILEQNNGTGGSVLELFIPWVDFNAGETSPDGLFHPNPPVIGEEWYMNIARISSDDTNQLPVWSYTTQQVFASRQGGGHAEITFAGTGEPTGACCMRDMCIMATEDACVDAMGSYQGDAVPCAPDICLCIAELTGDSPPDIDIRDLLVYLEAWLPAFNGGPCP